MKFLNVYCENRKATVYISLDKIILIMRANDDMGSLIEVEGGKDNAVKVATRAEDLIRKINGEDKEAVGFRTGR